MKPLLFFCFVFEAGLIILSPRGRNRLSFLVSARKGQFDLHARFEKYIWPYIFAMSSSDSEDEEQDNVEILLDNGGAFLAGGKVRRTSGEKTYRIILRPVDRGQKLMIAFRRTSVLTFHYFHLNRFLVLLKDADVFCAAVVLAVVHFVLLLLPLTAFSIVHFSILQVSGLVRVTRLEATECSRLELKASGALTLQWAKLVTHHKCNNRGKVLSKAYSSGSASHREKLMEVEMNLLDGGKKKENKEEEEKKEEEKEEEEGQEEEEGKEEEEEEEKADEEGDGDDDKEEGEGKADDGDGEDEEEDKEEEKEDEEHEQEEEKEEEKEEENDDNRTFVVPKGVTDYEFEIPLKEDLLPTFFSREGEADAHGNLIRAIMLLKKYYAV